MNWGQVRYCVRRCSSLSRLAALPLLITAGGCRENLFDVVIEVKEAAVLKGALDDLTVGFAYVSDVDEDVDGTLDGDGKFERNATDLAFSEAATTIFVEVEARDPERFGNLLGFGRSATVPVPEGDELKVLLLLAPAGVAGRVSNIPEDLGTDACAASDSDGTLYFTGGRKALQPAYVYDASLEAISFAGNGLLQEVGGVGCAAAFGQVAAVGGCTGPASAEVALYTREGELREIDATGFTGPLCGAAAAPRDDGQVWVVSSDNRVSIVGAGGGEEVAGPHAGTRRGLEVTADQGLVLLVDSLFYFDADGREDALNAGQALGRFGSEVAVLQSGSIFTVQNGGALKVQRGDVDVPNITQFVMLSDQRVVAVLDDGGVVVVAKDGTVDVVEGARPSSRVAAIAGDTILLAPLDGVGLDGVALPVDR